MNHLPFPSRALLIGGALLLQGGPAAAQALPRISALYPPGARVGSSLDVAIRGGGLDGAREVLVDGPGLTAALNSVNVKVDPADQKIFQAKCATCHEARGPATINRTADQWAATVDRMINDRRAPIEAADRLKIISYLQAAARASAGLTARVTIAPNASPGKREIRVVGSNGTSTAFPFDVTNQPEALEIEPNNALDKAPALPLPTTVSGQLSNAGDVDCFSFQAKQGERLVFNCYAFRVNSASQGFFFPVLQLFDAEGRELAKNTGYYSLDPLIDWRAPADGKYVVLVRDMLYRGGPGTIYRLRAGVLPYDVYLFPPGGRRGTTTQVTVAGENMQPATIQVPVPANAPSGSRPVSTEYGSFRFIAGDHPEYTEKPDAEPQAVTLPVSINGRIESSGEQDRYPFTITKETLGTYTFEAFAERIGSPVVARLSLRGGRGMALASSTGGAGTRDPRLDYTFTQPGDYVLEIADLADKFSAAHIYRISAGPADPDFLLTVSPDNPNLGPGSSVYLSVRVQRRVGIPGDIEVVLPDLPAGVSASPTVLRAGETQAFLILTAAPDAKPGTISLPRPLGRTVVNGKPLEREMVPYEIYRINNNAQIVYRTNMVVSVGPEIGWRASIQPSTMKMAPDSEPVTVTVRLDRRGVEADLPFAVLGVPPGIEAPRAILFKRGTSELTFTMRPTNTGIFAPRSGNQPGPPPYFLLAVVNGREGEGMMMSSPAVPVTIAANP